MHSFLGIATVQVRICVSLTYSELLLSTMEEAAKVKRTVFGQSHLNGPYKSWVKSSFKGHHFAMCKFCNYHINIETMGNSALTSHQKGKKHIRLVAAASVLEPVINNGASVSSLTSNLSTLSFAPDERSPNTMQSYVGTHLNGPYKSWVKSSSKGRYFAMCKFCNDDINIKTIGNSALTSQQKGKKHMKLVVAA